MRRTIFALLLTTSLIGTAAWAGDDDYSLSSDEPGTVGTEESSDSTVIINNEPGTVASEGNTMTTIEDVDKGYLSRERVGIRPQAGIIHFGDLTDDGLDRFAVGATMDVNMMPNDSPIYLGPSTGLIYSHLGGSGSNFFGTDSGALGGSSNYFHIPANLKLGVHMGRNVRLSAHGGANVTYRSSASSMALSDVPETGTDNLWKAYPNVGADLEWGSGNFGLILRPDVTITPGTNIFTGTLGFSASLG